MKNIIYKYFWLIAILLFVTCKKSDKEAPVISLNGDKNIQIILNSEFIDPGATAYDAQDGELSVDISDTVNVNLAGIYYISYSTSDASGNSSESLRTVNVYNSSEHHIGNFQTETQFSADTSFLTSIIQISTTVNNRLWVNGFSKYADASIYIEITSDSIINIPSQTIFVNSDSKYHGYKGTGIIKLTSSPKKIIIDFSDSTSITTINGKSILISN
jgi:hypothetical protein